MPRLLIVLQQALPESTQHVPEAELMLHMWKDGFHCIYFRLVLVYEYKLGINATGVEAMQEAFKNCLFHSRLGCTLDSLHVAKGKQHFRVLNAYATVANSSKFALLVSI